MAKVAIVLSGCGFLDGSEIYETTFLALALSKHQHEFSFFAPDHSQTQVMDYITKKVDPTSKRSVLHESARIARGDILPLSHLREEDFDALVLPGGFGVALNLSNYAQKGASCHVDHDLERIVNAFFGKKKIGVICFAPVILARILKQKAKLILTVGEKPNDMALLTELGMDAKSAKAHECIVDKEHKIFSTPGFMAGDNLSAIYEGIEALVEKI